MQIFLRILKELGIAIIFILLIVAILAFAFKDKVPFGTEVPEAVKYTVVDRDDFKVGDAGVEDKKNPDQVYQTSAKQLEEYITEKIVSPGRIAPFDSIESVPDVPSEIVSSKTNVPEESLSGTESGQDSTRELTLE